MKVWKFDRAAPDFPDYLYGWAEHAQHLVFKAYWYVGFPKLECGRNL